MRQFVLICPIPLLLNLNVFSPTPLNPTMRLFSVCYCVSESTFLLSVQTECMFLFIWFWFAVDLRENLLDLFDHLAPLSFFNIHLIVTVLQNGNFQRGLIAPELLGWNGVLDQMRELVSFFISLPCVDLYGSKFRMKPTAFLYQSFEGKAFSIICCASCMKWISVGTPTKQPFAPWRKTLNLIKKAERCITTSSWNWWMIFTSRFLTFQV